MKLQVKLLAVTAPLGLLAGAGIILLSRGAVADILIEAAAEPGLFALAGAAPRAEAGLRAKDERALLPLLGELVGRLGASYAAALDAEGAVAAHTDVLQRGRRADDAAARRALAAESPGFVVGAVEGRPFVEAYVPVWASDEDFLVAQEKGGRLRVGTLLLGMPAAQVAEVQRRIMARVALILLILGLAGGALGAFGVRRVLLLPVRALADSAARIGRGERDVAVPVTSRDELGELAENFNRMSRDLAATTVSKDYLDGVVSGIPDIVLVADKEGVIRKVNPAVRALGRAEEEVVGWRLDFLFERDESALVADLLAGCVVENRELNLMTKEDRTVSVLLSGSPIVCREGKTIGIVLVAKDLTERKKLEAMLLQSEKLYSVGQLAAGVAHEINNPLGIILGFAQSAARRLKPGDALELPVRSIEREARRCKRLVEDLLAFSRQGRARAERFDLHEAVEGTLGIVEAQARVRSVELRRELAPVPGFVGDKNQLQQVVLNLCNNAIDAMPEGGRLSVRTRLEDGRCVLEVEDDGTGIPEEIRARIFDPFFTTKEVGKGTGLGLALVYEIVQKHGGRIDVDSAVGRGTRFTVSIPMAGRA